jgi:hypothetical protein
VDGECSKTAAFGGEAVKEGLADREDEEVVPDIIKLEEERDKGQGARSVF